MHKQMGKIFTKKKPKTTNKTETKHHPYFEKASNDFLVTNNLKDHFSI